MSLQGNDQGNDQGNVQGTILVVDDEVRSQEALRRVLKEDFEVLCAGNAADAEKLLEGEIVHAILCDQRMPHESGVSFLKRVRELWLVFFTVSH